MNANYFCLASKVAPQCGNRANIFGTPVLKQYVTNADFGGGLIFFQTVSIK
jgi:hypothetical protein